MAAPADDSPAPFELFSSVRYDVQLRQVTGNREWNYAGWNYRNPSTYYMLDFHRDRLVRAATYWGWDAAVAVVWGEEGLRRLETVLNEAVGPDVTEPKRCKIILGKQGKLSVEVSSTPPATLACLFPLQFPSPGFMLGVGPPINNQPIPGVPMVMKDMRTAMGKCPYEVTLDVETTPSSEHTHYKTTRRQMYDAARQRAGITGAEPREVVLINKETGTIMDGSITTVYFWRRGLWATPPVPSRYTEASGSGGLDGTTRRWALERRIVIEDVVNVSALKNGEECWISNGVRGFIYGRLRLE